jgi:hypothetical protein
MAQQNISPNNPPILWSSVDEAFKKINANFTELYLSIGGTGVDLTSIASSLIPDSNSVRDLGSNSRRWNNAWITDLRLGNAQVVADGTSVDLPAGSKVAGELIRNPDESSFKIVRVSGQNDVVADNFQSVLNFAGTGINISTNAGTDTVTFANAGVTAVAGGTGINVSNATGNVTVSNSGVVSAVAGAGIGVSSATGSVTFSNTGVRQLIAGSGIVLDTSTGVITVTNSAPNVAQNVYRFIAVSGSPTLDPAGPQSTLNVLTGGNGLSITADPANNFLTFTNTGVTSLSVDNSFTISGGTGAVSLSLNSTLRRNLVGDVTGSVFADNSTMLLDGTGGTVVGPVQNNIADIKVFGGNSGEVISTDGSGNLSYIALPDIGNVRFNGNSITSDDSSGLVVVPLVNFNSDVIVENDLMVRNLLTVQGRIAGYISTAELKDIVAVSADFDDFKARMAAL